jgi:hypothetical protein
MQNIRNTALSGGHLAIFRNAGESLPAEAPSGAEGEVEGAPAPPKEFRCQRTAPPPEAIQRRRVGCPERWGTFLPVGSRYTPPNSSMTNREG